MNGKGKFSEILAQRIPTPHCFLIKVGAMFCSVALSKVTFSSLQESDKKKSVTAQHKKNKQL